MKLKPSLEELEGIFADQGTDIIERITLDSHPATCAPVPVRLHSAVYQLLEQRLPDGLYLHQAQALDFAIDHEDVCLATSTASGKSLVFITFAAHLLKTEMSAKIIAFYPAKALIQDQLNKWREILEPLNMEVGYIDGNVPTEVRLETIERCSVLLATPDVAHAWLMSNLGRPEVKKFVTNIRLIILDEAHVYDGVFGTNMAYFLRRLQRLSSPRNIISCTATVGDPQDFIEKLTGRRPHVFTHNDDGSPNSTKTIFLARFKVSNHFEGVVKLLLRIAVEDIGRFLAFADSRKMVERLAAAAKASSSDLEDIADGELSAALRHSISRTAVLSRILPYRAGYEEADRQAIQKALERGKLSGVVSTSALELGLDIGEIDIILLLNTPSSIKSFWQRIGRAGRVNDAVCLMLDDKGIISREPGGLHGYLNKPLEAEWLYLDNRYIQYANVLCAANEVVPDCYDKDSFETLPDSFSRLLSNELNPTEVVDDDLYPLKQKAQGDPHHEFPLRSDIEKNFSVHHKSGTHIISMGTLSYSQVLREAYPGAVYYYMARPYRVTDFRYKTGEIFVRHERHYLTRPWLQTVVFPKFQGGILKHLRSETGFMVEAELQVSERLMGFVERRGSTRITYKYEASSVHSQRPLHRFFLTTGVCWYFPYPQMISEQVAAYLLEAYCILCGIQKRDLGVGTFISNSNPVHGGPCQGACVYDSVHGSLRLTQHLTGRFTEAIELAYDIAKCQGEPDLSSALSLSQLQELIIALKPESINQASPMHETEEDWITVIAPGEKAFYLLGTEDAEEVEVEAYRYTPRGLVYVLKNSDPQAYWVVKASTIVPINGITKMARVNLLTGQIIQQKA